MQTCLKVESIGTKQPVEFVGTFVKGFPGEFFENKYLLILQICNCLYIS
jgi:hypothetical protein